MKPFLVPLLTWIFVMVISSPVTGQAAKQKTVAILLFEQVQIIDFTGPWETFGQAGFRIFTVAEKQDTIRASMGMKLFPDFTFEHAPDADILVIPGGGISHHLPSHHPIIQWIKEKEKSAAYILTVCNGAFVLGPAGFSQGLSVTTTAGMINHLDQFLEGCIPVYDKRFVHDGKFISAGGLTAGIDASLYLISLMYSKGRAQEVANKMEYNWDPEGGYARSKLADYEFYSALDFNPPLRKKVLVYEGDEHTWNAEFVILRNESLESFAHQMTSIAQGMNWKKVSEEKETGAITFEWTYTNHREESWMVLTSFSATPNPDEILMRVSLNRV